MGRADGVILSVVEGESPRVICVESGVVVLASRLHRRLGRWVRAASRRWGLYRGRPVRIGWSRIIKVGIEMELDLDADETHALEWEHWLLKHATRYLPSLKPRKEQEHGREHKGGPDNSSRQ